VLEEAGAVDTRAVQVGGPSGMFLSESEFERRLAFEDVPCAGAFMAFDGSRDLLRVIENFARFFAHESCGFCTPCRVGTTLNAQAMGRIASGRGSRRDIAELQQVSRLLRSASHCGLGTTAANPVLDGLSKFRPSFERRLRSLEVLPTFDLDEALAPAREITARDDEAAHLSDEAP
jgi:[NiFe] hydrogenase diaphorase moiety large subunit